MKKLLLTISILFFTFSGYAQEENTTYYLIRHAEKDRSDENNKNPELTEIGKQRAIKWSDIFRNVSFDAIYTTNYHRTIQTALPTSISQNVELQYYDPKQMYNDTFKKNTTGKIVLIVGHSNTTPQFVNKILGKDKYDDIDDSNNSNLYIVTCNNELKDVQVLYIE